MPTIDSIPQALQQTSDSSSTRQQHRRRNQSHRRGGIRSAVSQEAPASTSNRQNVSHIIPSQVHIALTSTQGPTTITPKSASLQYQAYSQNPDDARNGGGASRSRRIQHQPSGLSSQNGANVHISSISSRPFGNTLTSSQNGSAASSCTLSAEIAEFQPVRPVLQPANDNSRSKPRQRPRKRRVSRSTASDIATRIHEDINKKQYECPICTSEVLRQSKIWSCKTCWTVFHLSCIKTWSSKKLDPLQNGDVQPGGQWRCPGCNLPRDERPSAYTCWCSKENDPRSIPGLPPHSCGQTCGKERILPKKCPHPCELLCHAGPCPPCILIGPNQTCFCGTMSTTRRCIDTNYNTGWSCGQICGDMMPCGEHACPRPCHEGLCGACEIIIDARCYCGKDKKPLLCCDRGDEKKGHRTDVQNDGEYVSDDWTGLYQCAYTCERLFDCGIHQCEKPCHASQKSSSLCPRSAEIVTHCPCGKSPLTEISDRLRNSCIDPIPNCSDVCEKALACGHKCSQICHTGPCLPCMQTVKIQCRCGRMTASTICRQGTEEPLQCARLCRTTLNCGRHECGEHCCPSEKRASERHSSKRKNRSLHSTVRLINDDFEVEHICTRTCGRPLRCGNHTCQELCHKGQCGSCREAVFSEIACHCGRTVLQPPLPCGTKQPPCRFDCERPKTCGHSQIPHNCHPDNEFCPKCPFLTEKVCLCGKKALKNHQCWIVAVRCGEICGKRLKCGSHNCRKACHRPGECEDVGKSCQQACSKEKKTCGHPCEDQCHAPYPCKEDKPCQHRILITCDCQHEKQEMSCKASRNGDGNLKKTMQCDDECARLERNRKLGLALDIDPETHKDDHIPYSSETLNLYQENVNWSQMQEREFRVFAGIDEERRLRFKPMHSNQRVFLHHLAEDFGFDSESLDPEPHRHVLIFKSPKFVSGPSKTLGDCIRIRKNLRAAATATATPLPLAKASNISEPYNGLLLTSPRFALTLEELSAEIANVQGLRPKLTFNIAFLQSEQVAIKTLPQDHTERAIDLLLKELKLPLARAFKAQGFGSLQLCRFDSSLNVMRSENDNNNNEGGWNQVAAKAAAPRLAPQIASVGNNSTYTVLGAFNKKKPQEPVVEDWETAQQELEEEENGIVSHDRVQDAPTTKESQSAERG